MIKQIFGILAGGILVIIILGVALRQYGGNGTIFTPPTPKETGSPSLISTLTATLIKTPTATVEVPNTDGKGVVEQFLKAVSDHKPGDAVGFMASKTVSDDGQKQAWAVQFNAFKSLLVKSIEPSMPEEWSDTSQTYKVTMNVEMKPESADMPIPYFGYEKGTNIRWVSAEKTGTDWKVLGIATGP